MQRKGPGGQRRAVATHADEDTMASRARGALWGLVLGEALGGPCEFKNLVAPQFPQLAEGPYDELTSGGRCELLKGQTGQATQQAVVLSQVLRAHAGHDAADAARRYVRWQEAAFDVSEANRQSILQLIDGRTPEWSGRRAWLESDRTLVDNAALARTLPIGLYFCRDRQRRLEATLADGAITHFAPISQIACVVFNTLIAAAVTTPLERLSTAEVIKVVDLEISFAGLQLTERYPEFINSITQAIEDLRDDTRMAQQSDPELYGPDLHLFQQPTRVRLAFRLALWEALHAPSLTAGLIDVVNRGGDADTNAAITGALLGAIHGDTGLREDWKETVLEGPLALRGPLATTYHPRQLMPFAGQWAPAPATPNRAPGSPAVNRPPKK